MRGLNGKGEKYNLKKIKGSLKMPLPVPFISAEGGRPCSDAVSVPLLSSRHQFWSLLPGGFLLWSLKSCTGFGSPEEHG